MTSHQAEQFLSLWQLQRSLGIKPEDRRLPENDNADDLDRQIEAIREAMSDQVALSSAQR